ncbi:Endonuclease, HJR/Mrr/RecB family [Rhodoferax sp. OV413]|uniref:restriction endonuclease n=1 Tax=Rhodoferax sp. OV413 TaxID=1855285 RepID=UPI000888D2B8|nr:restriction endonuclease [Rhodoferax sp. OV413]SDP67754.1 Endonuclease, HJR/Mrr/RecB family [Rhodoferax sp. OV413]
MKFKMAPNSLFAILLRSPWWISMLLVLVFALASGALLPPQYVLFGAMGGLPFLVIGVLAAKRQWNTPSSARVTETRDRLAAMAWKDFANTLQAAYSAQGYTVTRINAKAADLRLEKNGSSSLVAAKRWKAANQGVEALRDLAADKQALGADQAIYISLGGVTDTAQRFAQEQGIQLLTDAGLTQLLKP